MKEDRLIYRHFSTNASTTAVLRRLRAAETARPGARIPPDLQIQIGSQWWCLRRRTIEWILDFRRKRRDVMRFFRTTWIPDETFFQTLVRHLVPEKRDPPRTLTFLMFTDYGMPVTFYNDHYDLLLSQDALFRAQDQPRGDGSSAGSARSTPTTRRAFRSRTRAATCTSSSPAADGSGGASPAASGKPKARSAASAN